MNIFAWLVEVLVKLQKIEKLVKRLAKEEVEMSKTTQEVLDQVRASKTVIDSLKVNSDNEIAFQKELKTKLDAAIAGGADPALLQQISDELGQRTAETQAISNELHTAVVEGTAAAGEVPA